MAASHAGSLEVLQDTLQCRAVVFVGFPGVGKTSFANACRDTGWHGREVVDLDPWAQSTQRRWRDYFAEVVGWLTQPVVLVLPDVDPVFAWLFEHRVPFLLFVPQRDCKQCWLSTRVPPEMVDIVGVGWDCILDEYHSYAAGRRCVLVELGPDVFLDASVADSAVRCLPSTTCGSTVVECIVGR